MRSRHPFILRSSLRYLAAPRTFLVEDMLCGLGDVCSSIRLVYDGHHDVHVVWFRTVGRSDGAAAAKTNRAQGELKVTAVKHRQPTHYLSSFSSCPVRPPLSIQF